MLTTNSYFPRAAALFLYGIILTPIFGSGCAQLPMTMLLMHEPMHPSASEPVTITAKMQEPVDRIILSYSRYALTRKDADNLSKTLVEHNFLMKECNSINKPLLECTHVNATFPDESLVVLKAEAYKANRVTQRDEYAFAIGKYPLPDAPIPIRQRGAYEKKYNIVLVSDTDLSLADFQSQLQNIVGLYVRYKVFSAGIGLYNFFYHPTQGHYEEVCQFTDPPNFQRSLGVAQAIIILHKNDLRDCRVSKNISSEINYDKSLIHESGHVLFNLGDEYCGQTNYNIVQSVFPNIWSSSTDCREYASKHKLDPANCSQILDNATACIKNKWRYDSDGMGGCIMGPRQHKADSDFGPTCLMRILHHYQQCNKGACVPLN